MRTATGIALTTLLLGACRCASSPPPAPPGSQAAEPAQTPTATPTATTVAEPTTKEVLFAWEQDPEGHAVTRILIADADGVREAARGPGLLLAAGTHVWQWRLERRKGTLHDCDCLEGAEDPSSTTARFKCRRRGPYAFVRLHDLASDAVVDVFDDPKLGGGDDVTGEYTAMPAPLASLGPYLLAAQGGFTYSCGGAHGFSYVEAATLDLRTGERTDLLTKEEHARLPKDLAAAALAAFGKRPEAAEEVTAEGLKVTMVLPRYEADGRLVAAVQVTHDACYACSDDAWSSYTVSERLDMPTLPASLAPLAQAPATLVRAKALRPRSDRRGGWTHLVGPSGDLLDRAIAALGAEAPSAPQPKQ